MSPNVLFPWRVVCMKARIALGLLVLWAILDWMR